MSLLNPCRYCTKYLMNNCESFTEAEVCANYSTTYLPQPKDLTMPKMPQKKPTSEEHLYNFSFLILAHAYAEQPLVNETSIGVAAHELKKLDLITFESPLRPGVTFLPELTSRGLAYVKHLLLQPLPVQEWVIPKESEE